MGLGREVLTRVLGDVRPPLTDDSWATRSVWETMVRGVCVGSVVWLLLLAIVAAVEPTLGADRGLLVLSHMVVACVSGLAGARLVPLWIPILLIYAQFLWTWSAPASITTVLSFACVCLSFLTHICTPIVLSGRAGRIAPLVSSVVVPCGMYLGRPDDGWAIPIANLAVLVSATLAMRFGLSFLYDVTQRADELHREAGIEAVRLGAAQASSRRAADDARTLHDTVVNTLAALASGGAATADAEAVRRRCVQDAETLAAILDSDARDEERAGHVRQAFVVPAARGISVVRSGLDDVSIAAIELPAGVGRAMTGAVAELMLNAAKHSGADHVRLDVRGDATALEIRVEDDGVGFDGVIPRGHGLANSVDARLDEAGVGWSIGRGPEGGTRAVLRWSREQEEAALDPAPTVAEADFGSVIFAVRRRAARLFAAGETLGGLFMAMVTHPGELSPDYAMVAINLVVVVVTWRATRGEAPVPGWVVVMLALAAPVAWFFTGMTVDFGGTDVVLWQVLCPVVSLVLATSLTETRRAMAWITAPYVLTIAAVAGYYAAESPLRAGATVVSGLVGLVFTIGWGEFDRKLRPLAIRAAEDQSIAQAARVQSAERAAAEQARRRWQAAALNPIRDLLDDVATGRADLQDPTVRERCSADERYLRQLIQLSPESLWMSEQFARTLAQARRSGVKLSTRSGDVDTSAADAELLGAVLSRAVEQAPPHGSLTASMIKGIDQVHFIVVGDRSVLCGLDDPAGLPDTATATLTSLAEQDLLEVSLAVAPG